MNAMEADYRMALAHLKSARSSMQRLMAMSDDEVAVTLLDEEFRNLQNACRDFAKYQCAMDVSERKRPRGGNKHEK